MKRHLLLPPAAFLTCIVLCVSPAGAQQRGLEVSAPSSEQRVALVIGNSAYSDAPLRNPVNDARDMAEALRELGFDVIHRENLNEDDTKRAIRAFGEKIRGGGVGLFYYAGHAVQVNGQNYLIPVGANINGEEEVEYESVDVGLVLAQMERAGNRVNIVILDACRNNPFARSFRSASKGLASIDAPGGTLIAYATAPGSVASDGSERNGLYTQELLKFMRTPGLDIEDVFKRVRVGVRNMTQGKQTPWESSSLIGDFYFIAASNRAAGSSDNRAESAASPEPKGDANYYAKLGSEMLGQNKNQEAEDAYRKALRINSKNGLWHNELGNALYRQEKYAESEAEYREAIRLEPQYGVRYANLGDSLLKQGKNAEAESAYRQALRIDSSKGLWHNELANALFRQEKYAEAEVEFREAIRLEPGYAIRHANLGDTLLRLGKNAEAEAAYRQALRIDSSVGLWHNELGNALFRQRKYSEAETAYRESVRLEPKFAIRHANLGDALLMQGKKAAAAEAYREALKIEPSNPAFLNSLNKALQ